MTNAPSPGGIRFSHVLWLLLPVVALPVGLWVGNLPIPDAKPAPPVVLLAGAATAPSAAGGRALSASTRAPSVHLSVDRAESPPSAAKRSPEPKPEAAGELSQWTSMDRALEESRRNGKPVFIDFSADWCGPCQRLKREVFDDDARAHTLQTAVIPVSIVDLRRETGSNPAEIDALQRQYQVKAFPTLVVFSPGTGRVMTTRGFRGADATLAWITEAAQAVR